MKNLQYQLLQYFPDPKSLNSINLGIVVFDVNQQLLEYKLLYGHVLIENMLKDDDVRNVRNLMNLIRITLNNLKENLERDVYRKSPTDSILEFTKDTIQKKYDLLSFSKVEYSKASSLKDLLFLLPLSPSLAKSSKNTRMDISKDHTVWRKMFLPYFKDTWIFEAIKPSTVKTKYSNIHYNNTWDSDRLNILLPVNLYFLGEENFKNKVHKYMDMLEDLNTSDILLNVIFLLDLSGVKKQNNVAYELFKSKSTRQVNVEIVTINIIGRFLEKEERIIH